MKIKFSAKLNLLLYTMLLVVTPFLMLQNYLQSAIGQAGASGFYISSIFIPYTVLILSVFLLVAAVFSRKYISKNRIIGIVIVLTMVALGQHASDFYFNHNFYDLQYNWHFVAYGIFAYLAYRRFEQKNRKVHDIILRTFLFALLISTSDEMIQVFISNRIFDISDIAKDLWGLMIGIVIVQVVILNAKDYTEFKVRQPKVKDYFKHPFVLTLHLAILSYIFIWISSLLTDSMFWGEAVFFTILAYIIIFFFIHIGKTKTSRWVVRILVICILAFVSVAVLKKDKHVSIVSDNLVVYNGLPIYYFDVLIYPNGRFRLMDKKTHFGIRDKQKLDDFNADIVLFGTGSDGEGGKGYNDQLVTEMRYSNKCGDVYQIIKLQNKEASRLYNEMTDKGKRVYFIIYNN